MDLGELRDKLGAIDRQILELAAERQRIARTIGRTKRDAGRATRDYRQERDVIERATRVASEVGFPTDAAEELMLLLIRSSLTVQEKDQVALGGSGGGKRVLVIGGAGKMGQWLTRFMSSQGYDVEIADPTRPDTDTAWRADWREGPRDHDVIVVAAPLGVSAEVLEELAADPPKGLIFDIGSLKSPLRDSLKKLAASGAHVTSVHPMFGPDTELLSGRHVIFVNLGDDNAVEEAKALFASTMAVQVDMALEDHDRLIAYVLGLAHALNIAFFTALAESGETAPKLAKMSSTTFDDQLRVSAKVARESPDLYFEIQSLNDYGTESLSALLYAVERLRSVVRAGDSAEFRKLMERGQEYLRGREETP